MPEVHKYVGFLVEAVFTVGWLWGLVALIRRRSPGQGFWTWLVVAQVIAGVQAAIGLILLLLGYRPDTWLHYVYGFGPLVVFLLAHQMAREVHASEPGGRLSQPWVVFAAAAFICFGLAGRALMTGLGYG
jgi:heme A synthase